MSNCFQLAVKIPLLDNSRAVSRVGIFERQVIEPVIHLGLMQCRLFLLFLLLVSSFAAGNAQLNLAIGEWESLQSYRTGRFVTQTPLEVVYSTGNNVFFLDKEELSIRRLTRADGLSETNVRMLRYHPPTGILMIIYQNSVIDLYYPDGSFETLSQIDNFNAAGGDTRINELFFGPGNLVYISAAFGLTALDLDDLTFRFTTFTGIAVEATAQVGDYLFAATQEGLYRVDRSQANVSDFSAWELLGSEYGLPDDYSSRVANVWKGELYFGVGLDVYRWNNANPELHYQAEDRDYVLQYLSAGSTFLFAGYRTINDNLDRQVAFLNEDGMVREVVSNCVGPTNYTIEDEQGRIWFGEDWSFIRYLPSASSIDCQQISFSGPRNDGVYRMIHDGQSLWVAAGGLDVRLSPIFTSNGLYRFDDNGWTSYQRDNTEAFFGRDPSDPYDDLNNIVGVGRNPVSGHIWSTSYFEGAVELDPETGESTLWDELNSSLQHADGEAEGRVRVGNVAFDKQGNTYLANALATDQLPVSVYTLDGNEWMALGQDCDRNEPFDIMVDEQGFVWQIHGYIGNNGITVLDPNGTPLDPNDDRCRSILSSNSDLPTNEVFSMATDLDGDVWVGTGQGVVVFACGPSVFVEERCNGRRPIVTDDDGNGAYLLETELIQCIAVDGANRKWIGTQGGAYLLSADGQEQLAFFDEDNSPLLDNNVKAIAVHPVDGTVYFGTEDGIIAYRSDASAAENTHQQELVIFPNPVEPGYEGPITIRGLARDARVKITDISGTLVYEDTATGGQFNWDGADYNGRKVQSGVYLIFSASNGRYLPTKADTAIGKIVVVR